MSAETEMPRYQCHKQVWALKIKAIEAGYIVPEDERYARFMPPNTYFDKHSPEAGGYYVVYDDGYKSYSPAEPFEAGYTLISGKKPGEA